MTDLYTSSATCTDPIPESEYPALDAFSGSQPVLPSSWECTALLHPFSPTQSNSTQQAKDSPFFEVCIANISYDENAELNARLLGSSGRQWFYKITPSGTTVSTNGVDFSPIDLGWALPTTNWFGSKSSDASCSGTSYLNWMEAQKVDWWKVPVGTSTPSPATWMWFDNTSKLPVRLMFGQGPVVSPTMGDKNQLALFQMFSFTYFSSFSQVESSSCSQALPAPSIPGFSFGNPQNYDLFTWDTNFGMTVFMTPVNEAFNPLPTRVLYAWKPDNEYQVSSDRSQSTLMKYTYDPESPFTSQTALLTGPAPSSVPPPANSGTGFLINYDGDTITNCIGYANFPFAQEPPNWAQIPAVQGAIQATVVSNTVLCPNNTVTIVSVLFPPSGSNYPDSTYLWTWYSPLNATGSSSRPVTFMQSQSQLSKGTSLALADYFYYDNFTTPIEACNFDVPPCDFTIAANVKWQSTGINVSEGIPVSIAYLRGDWTANPHDNGGRQYGPAGNPTYINAKPGYTMPGQNEGALIGRVGSNGTPFLVGNGITIPSGLTGLLELCINDDLNGEYGAGFTDNIGSVVMQVTVG